MDRNSCPGAGWHCTEHIYDIHQNKQHKFELWFKQLIKYTITSAAERTGPYLFIYSRFIGIRLISLMFSWSVQINATCFQCIFNTFNNMFESLLPTFCFDKFSIMYIFMFHMKSLVTSQRTLKNSKDKWNQQWWMWHDVSVVLWNSGLY